MVTFLDFEKPIAELDARVAELRETAQSGALNIDPKAFSENFFVGIIDFSLGDQGLDCLKRSIDPTTLEASGILRA